MPSAEFAEEDSGGEVEIPRFLRNVGESPTPDEFTISGNCHCPWYMSLKLLGILSTRQALISKVLKFSNEITLRRLFH